jgi:D-alanyl-D-alanine carboxypeptidase
MARRNWKIAISILVVLVIAGLSVRLLTRRTSVFTPPSHREIKNWGTVDQETAQTLQAILDEEVNTQKVPGFQAYLRTPDGKTWSGTSGTTDLARKHALKQDNVIRVGSVTKTFTAVLILKLVEEGRLSLDDPLATWFPQFPNAGAITMRHLLNHTSGIPEIIPKILMKSVIPSTRWQPSELVDIAAQDKPLFAPGSRFAYSNTNYILLGLIAEAVSGETVTDLLHQQILDPLGLQHTYFVPYEPAPADLVTGYDRDMTPIPGLLAITPENTSWATAAYTSGALASTADDLGVFFDSLFAGRLLSPATMAEMVDFVDAPNPGLPEQTGSGLGLMRLEVDGQELIGHIGQFMGSAAIAVYAPEQHDLIVVTSNLSNPHLVEVVTALQEAIK